jgi:hypothetical protein
MWDGIQEVVLDVVVTAPYLLVNCTPDLRPVIHLLTSSKKLHDTLYLEFLKSPECRKFYIAHRDQLSG